MNNDGFIDLFVSKGNVGDDARLRDARPEQPAARPARRHVRRGRRGGRASSRSTAGRGAALADLNLDGLLDLVAGEPRRAGARLAERRRGDGRGAGRDGQLARVSGSRQPGGNRDAIGAVVEIAGRRAGHAAASSSWAAGTPAASSAGRTSGSARRPRREVRVTWPDGEVGPWHDGRRRTGSWTSRAARRRPSPWTPPGG